MGLIDLGSVKGDTGSTGETGEKGDTGAKGVGISSIESITDGIRFCLTNGVNWDIELTPPTPTYDSIVCSAEYPILSYADGQSTDLYAQLMDGSSTASVSGVTVTFKQGSTVLGTAVTNSTGLATLSDGYESAGVGDVSLTATDGIILSETYTLKDAWYYDGTTHNWGSSEQTINKNINLPSAPFKIVFKINKQNYNSCFSYLCIGSSSSTYRVGDVSSGNGIMIYSDYSSQQLTSNIKPSLNTDVEVVYTYDTGVHTISANGTTLTATDTNISMDKLVKITGKANVMKDLMILPL